MYHTDAQVFQRLHSYSQSPRSQGGKEGAKSLAPEIGGAMEREKRAVEGMGKGKACERGRCEDSVMGWDGVEVLGSYVGVDVTKATDQVLKKAPGV